MRREDGVVFFVLGTVLASAAAFLYLTWFLFPRFVLLPTGMLVSAVVLGGLFRLRFRVGSFPAPASEVLRHLAHEFRLKGHRVTEKPDRIEIRIGRSSALKVHVGAMADATEVRYQVHATRAGWATLLLLALFDWTALVAIAAAVYVFLRVRSFAARDLLPLLPIEGGLPLRPPEDAVRTTLVDALAEGHRLAAEACETERSALWNFELVIITSSFLLWADVLISLRINSQLPSFSSSEAVLTAMAVSAGVAGVGSVILRRRLRPRLASDRAWADRLSAALAREARRGAPEGAEPSSFELLAEASMQVPSWIDDRRRARIPDDSGPGILSAMAFVLGTVALFVTAAFAFRGEVRNALFFGLAGVGLSVGAEFYRRLWRREQEDSLARTGREWERRIASLHDRLDSFLRDL